MGAWLFNKAETIMSNRSTLRSSTMLSGIVGCTFLAVWTASAADPSVYNKAPIAAPWPAVDAVNEKMEAFGGSVAGRSLLGVNGSVTFPLGWRYGAQVDGTVGSLDNSATEAIAGHFFWRDPHRALFGLYVNETFWDRNGGVNVGHVAAEGEYYFGHFTLQGIAGVEYGNTATNFAAATAVGPTVATTTTLFDTFSVKTRFFDAINLKYYFGDDLSGYLGHRFIGGKNALALGGEIARPLAPGILGSAFVEARVGDGDFHGIWGGLKIYFGPDDKPLIARHRQEDPNNWNTDSLFGILNNHSAGGSTTAMSVCPLGVRPGTNRCERPFVP
jgi:hypothetical protein